MPNMYFGSFSMAMRIVMVHTVICLLIFYTGGEGGAVGCR
jgi:hypothetical protein